MGKLAVKRSGRDERLYIIYISDGSRFGRSEVFELSVRYGVNVFFDIPNRIS